MSDYKIISVDSSNIEEYGFFCIKNKKHDGYAAKLAWLKRRFEEGMRIKLIRTADGKDAGFLEYIPGKYTWRVIHAVDYLVIHCIWVASNKFPFKGMASALLQDCLEDAKFHGKAGAAVVVSDGVWMADRKVFIKNGFKKVDEAGIHFQLLVKQIANGPMPAFPKNWDERLKQSHGLQLFYTDQCPYIRKAVNELPAIADLHGIELKLHEFNDAQEARKKMPSPYGTISLVHNSRILAEHPISTTRFKNILQKDLNLKMRS